MSTHMSTHEETMTQTTVNTDLGVLLRVEGGALAEGLGLVARRSVDPAVDLVLRAQSCQWHVPTPNTPTHTHTERARARSVELFSERTHSCRQRCACRCFVHACVSAAHKFPPN